MSGSSTALAESIPASVQRRLDALPEYGICPGLGADHRCPGCRVLRPVRELGFGVVTGRCGAFHYVPTFGFFPCDMLEYARYLIMRERDRLGSRQRALILARDDHTCRGCGVDGVDLEVHHIVPFADWGTHDADNLISFCWDCHRTPTE